MPATLIALLSSRKFWVGTITVAAIVGAVALRVTGKIESADLVPTITAITATGLGVIGSIAWEDAAGKKVEAARVQATMTPPSVENAVALNVAQPQALADAVAKVASTSPSAP